MSRNHQIRGEEIRAEEVSARKFLRRYRFRDGRRYQPTGDLGGYQLQWTGAGIVLLIPYKVTQGGEELAVGMYRVAL